MNLFLKHMTNDNIESHKEIGPHTLSKRYIFGKPQEGGGGIQMDLQPFSG